jgi:hypothetical protein
MPCGIYTINDVPDANLGAIIGVLQLDHPLKIDTKKENDGQWTVIATFPPCEEEPQAQNDVGFRDLKSNLTIKKSAIT